MLLRLPLFMGMGRDDLFEVLEKVTFRFRKAEDGELIIRQGEQCGELTFLMNGALRAETKAPHVELMFSENHSAYMVIEPQSLFGKRPCYKATYRAQGEVSLLSIDKQEVYRLLGSYEIFRINLLNILGSTVERLHEQSLSVTPCGLEGRIALFIASFCSTLKGEKTLRITMEDLARLLDDTRLNVSRVLNKWRKEELIIMRRKEFIVPDIQKLIASLEL